MSFFPFVCLFCLSQSSLKRLCNLYLNASRQTHFQTTNVPQFNPEKESIQWHKKKLFRKPEARFPLFHHKHRLLLYQVYITARMWKAYPLLMMETGLALLHPLLCPPCWKPSSDFQSFYVCQLLDGHTDGNTATRAARPSGEEDRWICVFYRYKVTASDKKVQNHFTQCFYVLTCTSPYSRGAPVQ